MNTDTSLLAENDQIMVGFIFIKILADGVKTSASGKQEGEAMPYI